MAENGLSSKKGEGEAKTSEPKTEVLLALIQHASRPAAILLIALVLIVFLFTTEAPLWVKYGSLEFQLRATADAAGVAPELRALTGLNDEQLQLFLVIGKKRAHITYEGEDVTEENLEKLRALGLLAEVQRNPDGRFWWRVSEKGHTLHNIIRAVILPQIRRSGAA